MVIRQDTKKPHIIYIEQDDLQSDPFWYSLSDEPDGISGIRAHTSENPSYEIDCSMFKFNEWKEFLRTIVDEKDWYIIQELCFKYNQSHDFGTVPEPLAFGEFWKNIKEKLILPPQPACKIVGDITNLYISKSGVSSGSQPFGICTMIDEQDMRHSLRIYIPPKFWDSKYENLLDQRVTVYGIPEIYDAIIQIKAIKIDINSQCSRIEKIERWEKELEKKNCFSKHLEQDKFHIEFNHKKYIAVISHKGTRGYQDFRSNLNHAFTEDDFDYRNTIMNPDTIAKEIANINADREHVYDCICIIRGGGNPEELLKFSQPNLVEAIHNSVIPIITGIGHEDDELLCDRAADFNAGTPTGVADKLNEMIGIKRRTTKRMMS